MHQKVQVMYHLKEMVIIQRNQYEIQILVMISSVNISVSKISRKFFLIILKLKMDFFFVIMANSFFQVVADALKF